MSSRGIDAPDKTKRLFYCNSYFVAHETMPLDLFAVEQRPLCDANLSSWIYIKLSVSYGRIVCHH